RPLHELLAWENATASVDYHQHFGRSYQLLFLGCILFFFNDPATTEIYTLSLHDALPILTRRTSSSAFPGLSVEIARSRSDVPSRSEEHTSELQSRGHLVCRLLLEKKEPTRWRSRPSALFVWARSQDMRSGSSYLAPHDVR